MLLILVLVISFIHVTTSSESLNYRNTICQEKISYMSGSAFEANLNETLFTQLVPKASTVKFSDFTEGSGLDQVNALFYCRGDVDYQTCHDCVSNATKKIKDTCKFLKEGIVWFDECTLRYANRTFFSIAEERPNFIYINSTGIVNDYRLDPYKDKFDSTMKALIQEAAYSEGRFATKEVNLSSTEIIGGLAQCTPEIASPGCYKCLTTALGLRDTWANTLVFLPSCLFRYDLYGTEQPPAPSPSPSTRGFHIALMVVLPILFIVLAVIGGPWLWKRCSRASDENRHNLFGVETLNLEADAGDQIQGLPTYTFSQVEQMTEGFKEQLGSGGFGVVYRGHLLGDSRKIAVKVLNENDSPKQFSNEINVFVRISHNNLVSLLGYCEDGNRLALIYEYMDNGDLRALLSDNGVYLSWTDRLKIAIDTAEGLHYLHRHCKVRIVHRDVKPANILLNVNLQAKVADFGFSKIFPEDVTTLRTRVVTSFGYTAPEYFSTGMLNEKVDVYSFGVVLLELITGKAPSLEYNLIGWFVNTFNEGDIENILDSRMIRGHERTNQVFDDGSVWGATELAKRCVEEDETKRPSMWEIVVKLKECLDMEVKKNAGNSRSMESPLVSGSLSMGPDVR